jgi:hypothetical protein
LTDSLIEILSNKKKYKVDTEEIKRKYDPDTIAREYEDLFEAIKQEL